MTAQLIGIVLNFLPLLLAIVLHEIAHGYAAWKLGDDTAKINGRLSLNPLKHIDPAGTIILPALLIYSGVGFVFGWAKPVPVNFSISKTIGVTRLSSLRPGLRSILFWLLSAHCCSKSFPTFLKESFWAFSMCF